MAIVSGPEPQRSIFCEILRKELSQTPGNHLLVSGQPGKRFFSPGPKSISNLKELPHLNTEDMTTAILTCKWVVCRPGYSTIMDLKALGKKNVLFVPTPGQPEQIYLAKLLQTQKVAPFCKQENFVLKDMQMRGSDYSGFPFSQSQEDTTQKMFHIFSKNTILISQNQFIHKGSKGI